MKEDQSLTRQGEADLRLRSGGGEAISRSLLREHRLELRIGGESWLRLVCTRRELRQLVLGRLFTDRRIDGPEDVTALEFSPAEDRADISLRPGAGSRSRRPLEDRSGWRPEDIFRLADHIRREMPLHEETWGTHGCLLMHRGEILCCCEDIGRHNALDKAVGEALLRRLPPEECILYTSGRIASDAAAKAVAAGIPVLVTKALPTADAVDLARSRGLTLLGRAWAEQYEVYARPV